MKGDLGSILGRPPRASRLLAEAWAIARSAPVASGVIALVAAVMCLTVFATAGRAAVTEAEVVARIDDAGSRLITLTTTGFEAMPVEIVAQVNQLNEVAWAVGLGPVTDVRNAAVDGPRSPARTVTGLTVPDLVLTSGRWPGPGEVVVSGDAAPALGLSAAAGGVQSVTDGRQADVVGAYQATGALSDLDHLVLYGPRPQDTTVTTVYVLATDVRHVPALAVALREVSGVEDVASLAVTTSQALVDLTDVVSGRLGAFSRELAAVALAAGGVFVAVAMLAIVAGRRRDMGRRRALGASRSALVFLVVGQALAPALLGAAVGTGGGVVWSHVQVGGAPALAFCVAVPVLSVLAAVAGALPAAIVAAGQDPVRILRVP